MSNKFFIIWDEFSPAERFSRGASRDLVTRPSHMPIVGPGTHHSYKAWRSGETWRGGEKKKGYRSAVGIQCEIGARRAESRYLAGISPIAVPKYVLRTDKRFQPEVACRAAPIERSSRRCSKCEIPLTLTLFQRGSFFVTTCPSALRISPRALHLARFSKKSRLWDTNIQNVFSSVRLTYASYLKVE